MAINERPRFVVLGAGFGGIEAALELARKFPRESDADIVLIDRNNFLLYTPMLIEVLGGQVDMLHIVAELRRLSPRITFQRALVNGLDLSSKTVTMTIGGTGFGDPASRRTIQADHLVIAMGSVPNYYGIPGLQSNAYTMKNLCDAVGLRNRALALLERANSEPDAAMRASLLTFVIGGGGFSGVETAAALHDLLKDASRYYPNIRFNEMRMVMIEAMDRLLPELDESLAGFALERLRKMGIEVMLSTKIIEAGPDYIELEGNICLPMHTLVWTGGVSPVPVIKNCNCKLGRHGGIVTEPTCAVPDCPGVWALGDCAEVPQPNSPRAYAPTAQNATREGKHVAKNIVAVMRGQEPKPFAYTPIGEVAALGKRSGVASIKGLRFSGFPAWFMWRSIYLFKLPRLRQKVHVAIDWTVDLLFGRDIVEMPSDCFAAGFCGDYDGMANHE